MLKKKTKDIAIVMLFLFVFGLFCMFFTGCTDMKAGTETTGISVVASIFPCYDFARQIGGDNVDVSLLVRPGSDGHSYKPTSAELIAIGKCDLFIYVGGESDKWIDDIIDSLENNGKNIRTLKLMDCVSVLEEDDISILEVIETHNEETEYDEHVWTSLRNAGKIVSYIRDAFCAFDSENSETYKSNCSIYTDQLEQLDADFAALFNSAENKTMIFGDRFPFLYFTSDYDIPYYAAFPGCAEQTEPSIATISRLIDKVKEENISTIFYMDMSNSKTADSIAEATGSQTACLYSCHNVTQQQFSNNVTYLALMTMNYGTIKMALEK